MLHNGKDERRMIKRKDELLRQFLGDSQPSKFNKDNIFGGEFYDESNRLNFERFRDF